MAHPLREHQSLNGPWLKKGLEYDQKLMQAATLSRTLWYLVDHQITITSYNDPKAKQCLYSELESGFDSHSETPSHMRSEDYIKWLSDSARMYFKFIAKLSFVGRVKRMHFSKKPSKNDVYIEAQKGELNLEALLSGVGLKKRVDDNDSCFLSGEDLHHENEKGWLRIPFFNVPDLPIQYNTSALQSLPTTEKCWITNLDVFTYQRSPNGIVLSAFPVHSSYEGVIAHCNTNTEGDVLPNGSILRPTYWPFR
jgi:hypothetical protein